MIRSRPLSALRLVAALGFVLGLSSGPLHGDVSPAGYYRFPAIHGETLVFTAEGDLWTVGIAGGEARRLTSHPGQETRAALSPDGSQIAFSAEYEGPREVYVMPLAGGLPRRLSWEGRRADVVGWTPAGEILYTTSFFSTLPQIQLAAVDPISARRRLLPLAQASDGFFDAEGTTLFFVRLPFQGSYTKRYQGGAAQKIWRFSEGQGEAVPITADFPGTSHSPMGWQGRIYFASDRDGTLNLWSMNPDGSDPTQLTHHKGWDVKAPDLDDGRIVYQLGADLHLFEIATGTDRVLPITLPSDFDQRRVRWVDEPLDYLTDAHLSPSGDRAVLTARGQVFVAPVGQGRWVEATRKSGVRYRSARFMPDGKGLLVLSDESGEVELWQLDARGIAAPVPLTDNGTTLRFDAVPAPRGHAIALVDKNQELWVFDRQKKQHTRVAVSEYFNVRDFAWSPDGRFLAYTIPAENFLTRVWIFDTESGQSHAATSDRFDSGSPAWSPDGRFLYLLSDRNLVSASRGPWGSYQTGPLIDQATRIYLLHLRPGTRSPFAPKTELEEGAPEEKPGENGKAEGKKAGAKKAGAKKAEDETVKVEIDFEGLAERLETVPVPPGNYQALTANGEALFFLASDLAGPRGQFRLMALKVDRDDPKPVTVADGLVAYELSADGKKLLLQKDKKLAVVDAGAAPVPSEKLAAGTLDLTDWTFPLDPKEEWRQMFTEAWRLLRDYFYDPGMHGVDWPGVLAKYRPLLDRVTDRAELSDLFGEMSGELSTLHHYVYGGEFREGPDDVEPASLGAVLERDETAGGLRVTHLYRADPDMPEELSPLARPGVGVKEGDVITAINGVPTLSVVDPGELLRHQAGRQVLLAVRPGDGSPSREVIAMPLTPREALELRYDAWEYQSRQEVEAWGDGQIGYVHLRALGAGNYTEWARHFFPVYDRKGLVIDLRHNQGGNIDSWILGSLIKPAWMWWQPRVGVPYRNMQFAFTGHAAVVIDELTISDGEAFAEGFRRLGLGKVVGRRSWGGEIWLTSSNVLVDNGIATAAEYGVYGPEGAWLIEGHGVDPDIPVDNLPHATFGGEDAQLRAAVEHLLERIREDPPTDPPAPPYPDKSHPDWP